MIVVRIYEGLGNQMFEYAYAYALSKSAERKNIKVYLDMRDKDVTVYDKKRIGRPLGIQQFSISLPIANNKILKHWNFMVKETFIYKAINYMQNHKLWKYQVVREEEFNYSKNNLKIRDYSYLVGWFQHYQYFEKYRDDLLKEFTLKRKWLIPVQLQQIMNEHQVVSVHIRKGDYVTNSHARKVMCVCKNDYYIRGINYLKSRLSNLYLFIFTNDEGWVKENLEFDIPYAVISNHYNLSDIQEMMLMSLCNHNIIANSTFSWWGAWMNTHKDKIVIAPKKWFVDGKRENIAMKGWVRM